MATRLTFQPQKDKVCLSSVPGTPNANNILNASFGLGNSIVNSPTKSGNSTKSKTFQLKFAIKDFNHLDMNKCLNKLIYGTYIKKATRGGKGAWHYVKLYILEDNMTILQWLSKKKSFNESRIHLTTVSNISELPSISFGNKINKKSELLLAIQHSGGEMVLCFDTRETKDEWWNGLQYFVLNAYQQYELQTQEKTTIIARDAFFQFDKQGNKTLDKNEILDAFKGMHILISKKHAMKLFESSDLNQNGELDYDEFLGLVKQLIVRKELLPVYEKYAEGHVKNDYTTPYMTLKELIKFFEIEQRQSLTDTEALNFINRSKEEGEISTDKLSFMNFVSLLYSELSNSIFNPKYVEIYQEMDRPLNDYYICSSHNTYLVSNQLTGYSSINAYVHALMSGFRLVELDLWNGENAEPIVYHGHTLTSKLFLRDICKAIRENGFENNPYPIIFSFEMHCDVKGQEKVAKILKEELGSLIYLLPDNFDEYDYIPSPQVLMNKILIKGKRSRLPGNKFHLDEEFPLRRYKTLKEYEFIARKSKKHEPAQVCSLHGMVEVKEDDGEEEQEEEEEKDDNAGSPLYIKENNTNYNNNNSHFNFSSFNLFDPEPGDEANIGTLLSSPIKPVSVSHSSCGKRSFWRPVPDFHQIMRKDIVTYGIPTIVYTDMELKDIKPYDRLDRSIEEGVMKERTEIDEEIGMEVSLIKERMVVLVDNEIKIGEWLGQEEGRDQKRLDSVKGTEGGRKGQEGKGNEELGKKGRVQEGQDQERLGKERQSQVEQDQERLSKERQSQEEQSQERLGKERQSQEDHGRERQSQKDHGQERQSQKRLTKEGQGQEGKGQEEQANEVKSPEKRVNMKQGQEGRGVKFQGQEGFFTEAFGKASLPIRRLSSHGELHERLSIKELSQAKKEFKEVSSANPKVTFKQEGETSKLETLDHKSIVKLDTLRVNQLHSNGNHDNDDDHDHDDDHSAKDDHEHDEERHEHEIDEMIFDSQTEQQHMTEGAAVEKMRKLELIEPVESNKTLGEKDNEGYNGSSGGDGVGVGGSGSGGSGTPKNERLGERVQQRGGQKLAKKKKICQELEELYSLINVKWNLIGKRTAWHVSSISESKINKLYKRHHNDLIDFHKKYITKVYPSGIRIDSSNYNPIPSWNTGIQCVALNCQTADEPMYINYAKFIANGACGYVLKPRFLQHDSLKLLSGDLTMQKTRLTIKVISGKQLRDTINQSVNKNSEIVDPYVEIKIKGMETDEKVNHVYKTYAIQDNGFNPVWSNHEKECVAIFNISAPDLCTVLFYVRNENVISSNLVGWYSIELKNMMRGYRVIPLFDQNFERILHSYILCYVSIEGYTSEHSH